jgi:hypothetical protein
MMKLKASKKESQANPERARALARYGAYLSAARGDPEKARALFKKFSHLREICEGLISIALGKTRTKLSEKEIEAIARVVSCLGSFDPLVKRVEALEQAPQLKHAGVWHEGKSYAPANLTTHRGGMWLCNKRTKQEPGQSRHWTLVVKSGAAA